MKQQICRKALKTLDSRRLWTMWKLWMEQMYKWETVPHIIVKTKENKLFRNGDGLKKYPHSEESEKTI